MERDVVDRLVELRDQMRKNRASGVFESEVDIQVLTDAIIEIQRLRENQRV